jgi:hypothetical protein
MITKDRTGKKCWTFGVDNWVWKGEIAWNWKLEVNGLFPNSHILSLQKKYNKIKNIYYQKIIVVRRGC